MLSVGVYSHDDPISIKHKKTASLETVLLFSPLKKFLKVGSTLNPIDSLKLAGVDLNKKEVVESAIKMFDETINEFIELSQESK